MATLADALEAAQQPTGTPVADLVDDETAERLQALREALEPR